MKFKVFLGGFFVLGVLGIGCSALHNHRHTSPIQAPNDISIMTYNVENLFDTVHDEGTEDHAFLPLSKKHTTQHKQHCETIRSKRYRLDCLYADWSEPHLKIKMKRLAATILQVNHGKGPDILIMPEVENIQVLKRFNEKYLKVAQYKTWVHIEGPDKRGIDVSILTRLPNASDPILHKIPFQAHNQGDKKWMNRSRGILESHFTLPDGQKIAVFGLHFPSPRNPTYWRQQAITFLNYLKSKLPKDTLAIAAGDFNISRKEEKSYGLYDQQLGKKWLISHKVGCHHCKGTNYYHTLTQWSFLDAILFDKRLSRGATSKKSTWYVDQKSISIPNHSIYQVNKWGSPAHFNKGKTPIGVSDHWPVFAILKRKKQLDSFITPKTVPRIQKDSHAL